MGPLYRLKKLLSLKKKKKKLRAKAEARRKASGEDASATQGDEIRSERLTTGLTRQHEILNTENNRKRQTLLLMNATIEVLSIVKEASEATSVLEPLKAVCVTITKLLELANAKILEDLDLGTLFNRLEAHFRLLETERLNLLLREERDLMYTPNSTFLDALQSYLKTLEAIKMLVENLYQAKHGATPVLLKSEPVTVIGLEIKIDTSLGVFVRQLQICILEATIGTSKEVLDTHLSHLLKGALDARGERVKPITPGTRLALIERLDSWAQSVENDRGDLIFWLHDEAGTGKSALAAHMARRWCMEGALAGQFFFNQNGGRNLRKLDRLCVSLAQEMSENYPSAKSLILQAMEGHSSRPFPENFYTLLTAVVGPIIRALGKPLVFVIDALDECADDDAQLLITTILSAPSNTEGARFLLTSRPTKELTAVLDGVNQVSGKGVDLLDVKNGDIARDRDVKIYVRHTLQGFSTIEQDVVIECAKGVFLWATLACETLQRTVTPTKVLRKLQSNTPDSHMTTLYETILESALPLKPSSRDYQLLRSVLQGVILTYIPVSIFSVQSFFPKERDSRVDGQEYVEFFVKKLGSIMKDGTPHLPIYLLHPTFKEFIENQKANAKFYVSPPAGHHIIATACLDLLSDLPRNVLGLRDPNYPLPIHLPPQTDVPARLTLVTHAPFRYALSFWATHAALALGEHETIRERVTSFLESSFLAWVEWSSALKELSESIEGLRLLLRSVRVQLALEASRISNATATWCLDSLRFLQRNGHIIESCGVQAWVSALVFTPRRSIVYQTFHQASLRPLPEVISYHADHFDSHRILDDAGHNNYVAALSPDGKRLLSHDGFGVFRLWNMKSLKRISILKHEQTMGRMEADFSSDGSLIVTGGGEDAEIYLWDGFSGARKERLLPQLHSDMLIDIAFALSDRAVISIAKDGRIIRWSVTPTERWTARGQIMRGEPHRDRMTKLAVSPDGKLVATFSVDFSVRIWSAESAEAVGIPILGSDEALSGAFSIDGTKVVVGYRNGEVIIWAVAAQVPIHRLESDGGRVYNVTISPDGRTVASGNKRLCLWDINTGKLLCPPLVGHTKGVGRLAFDREGNRLVSGSMDHTVRVWDIRRSQGYLSVEGFVLKGHTSYIHGIHLSPDGRWVISASEDGTIRVWDTDLRDTSDSNEAVDFPHNKVNYLAISACGSRLVSADEDGTFQVWDAVSGAKIEGLLQLGEGRVVQVLFSSSIMLWASSHSSGSVCLWQHEEDNVAPTTHVLSCHQGPVKCMEFGPDASFIAIGAQHHAIQLWDIATYNCQVKLDCSSNLSRIAISSDGKHLASYSADEHLRLWDLSSNQMTREPTPVKGQDFFSGAEMDYMIFSPDGKTIATSYGYILRLFDVGGTLRCFAAFLKRSRLADDMISPMPAFSADSKYVFYGHHILNLAKLSRQGHITHWPTGAEEGRAFNPISPLFIGDRSNHILSERWSSPLLVIPAEARVGEWVAKQNKLAFGTTDGRVFILRFPKEYI